MLRVFHGRAGHYLLLIAIWAVLTLPNLGGPSLWDIDEGNNSACAREMLVSGDYVVPFFNGAWRFDKPALLYWLVALAYRAFGVGEFAARLPSAVAALVAVLATYELGRRLFDAGTGLLGGLVLASATLFCAAGHFANPDALLSACMILTFLCYWLALESENRRWLLAAGVATGLGVLAKGPVAIVLPAGAIGLYLLWSRRLKVLWDRHLFWAGLVCFLVFAPWYAWVANDTRGAFLRGFFLTHNVERYLHPMEGHGGGLSGWPWIAGLATQGLYYPLVLLVGLAPWSVFLGLAAWYGLGRRARVDAAEPAPALPPAYRFLWCWIAVCLVFFTLAGTKLPNYILPLYAPTALLIARFLERWRRRLIEPGRWMHAALLAFALIGVSVAVVVLLASGVVLPGLAKWAALGAVPVLGTFAAAWQLRQQRRGTALAALSAAAVAFLGVLAAGGASALDAGKAPRPLVRAVLQDHAEEELRLACFRYFQPSLVFYSRRQIDVLADETQVVERLRYPLAVYLFLPAAEWDRLQPLLPMPCRVVSRHRDMYRRCDVVVVTNQR